MGILIPREHASKVYITGLALLVIGLPLSKFLMSVSQFILAAYWLFGEDSGITRPDPIQNSFRYNLALLAQNIASRCRRFFRNPSALILASLFILHLIGLLWTSDFEYGLHDVRKKIPLLVIPLIIATSDKLNRQQFDLVMALFVSAVFIGTMISMAVVFGIIERPMLDIREISIFISHIRFSLLIVLSFFALGFYAWHKPGIWRIVFIALMLWFMAFLVILESMTGLIILVFTGSVLIAYYSLVQKQWWRKVLYLSLLAAALGSGYVYINNLLDEHRKEAKPEDVTNLDLFTPRNKPYYHDTIHDSRENGHYVWTYVCWEELETEWNKRSALDFNGRDLKGNELKHTLIRFLASKGDRKDADGIHNLDDEEVKSIEKGVANVDHQGKTNFTARLKKIAWEIDQYREGGNPSGHSVTQRMEFWKAAAGIIDDNKIIGVGTGDVANAFAHQYEKMNSPLSKEWRLRSHNQFLAITVAFGYIGLLWFLVTLVYPMLRERRVLNYFYITFFLVAVLSMLTEDTLETQAGVTFFAFFNAFFLFSRGRYEGKEEREIKN